MSTFWQVVNICNGAVRVFDNDLRVHVAFEVNDRLTNRTTSLFLDLHCFAFDDIFEANLACDLRQNWNRVWIPLTKHLVLFDFFVIGNGKHRTLWDLVIFKFTTTWIENCNFTVSVKNNGVAFVVGYITHAGNFDSARFATCFLVLFGSRTGHTTDMECTHRQLRSRFTDTLSSDDTNGHAFFDQVTSRHVHSIATTADT